jgi:hypothetical protein
VAWGIVEARRYNQEIAKIKAAGEPLVFADLDAGQPAVKEADDAAPYYESAIALLRDREDISLNDALEEYDKALRNSPTSRPASKITEGLEHLLVDNTLSLDIRIRVSPHPGR